ncbi:MAG: FAD binding domain-containing protein [Armatimonadetes bacterium]|nr:FAD binding domain-containing protein [Armatimonadota bacterium]
MLRLSPFELLHPRTPAEAVALLGRSDARLVSGGTDLLPAMKQRLCAPRVLVSLRDVEGLRGVRQTPGGLVIGAATRLQEIAEHPLIQKTVPVLAAAASRVASPQVRNSGTLGGNLCLDTRCRYYNQSPLYREALGGCLKSGGDRCHVVAGGRSCVAALCADTVPVLIALDAELDILGPRGERLCPLEELYNTDGCDHLSLDRAELLRSVRIRRPTEATMLAYRKWAVRDSIDFPLVSAALRLEVRDRKLQDGRVVAGVLGPRPRVISLSKLKAFPVGDELAQRVAEEAYRGCKPLPNVPYDPEYRRIRLRVEVLRAAQSLFGGSL